MRVATYTRISTDEDHQSYSLEAQAEHLGAYVKSQEEWELTRRFSDQASGATTERPGLQRAMAEARTGRFDMLLVYRVDRFPRSARGLAQLLEDLDAAGVAFRSATEPFDTTTAAGRMMVQMLAVLAEFERATIVDRVIAGMERKAARCGWCGGSRPFGYDVDPATGYLTPAPDEAPLVPVLFDRYRYRYNTCFTRQRYGTKYCDAERLPADELDGAILDALLHVYERTDLFDKAVAAARRRARAERANHDKELAVVDAGITKAEDAIERYLSAFEAGTLSEAQCGKRLEGLATKVRDLRERREELVVAVQQASATAPDAEVIAEMRHHIEKAVTDGAVPARKALLQALVHEIRVEGRDRVVPWFRVPGGANPKVRALARSAWCSQKGLTSPSAP